MINFSKLLLISDGYFVLILIHYGIILRYSALWTIDLVLFLDIQYTYSCVPPNIGIFVDSSF